MGRCLLDLCLHVEAVLDEVSVVLLQLVQHAVLLVLLAGARPAVVLVDDPHVLLVQL